MVGRKIPSARAVANHLKWLDFGSPSNAVERAILKLQRPVTSAGLTATRVPEESEARELPTGRLAAAQLPADVLLFVSGQKAMPTLADVKDALAGRPAAPTALTAVVQ